ncbi:MAG: hypothetical protein FWD17_13475 [Polyangiaceae bacterium]|nr:hypothetical protein [Polyangiaceae bacterium]
MLLPALPSLPRLPAVSPALVATGATLGAVLAALLPTCLFFYVEPRGRVQWGDAEGPRPAPVVVRAAAWTSFAVGQVAIPWLVVPALCLGLGYLQIRLGAIRPVGLFATAVLAALALVQSILTVGLIPSGIRLLMNDTRRRAGIVAAARGRAIASAATLALALSLAWSMHAAPGLVHPWLRAALEWAALRPVALFAALCLLQSLLLWRAGHALSAAAPARVSATGTAPRKPGKE